MKIQIILGTTREGRMSERVAKWVAAEASKRPNIGAEIVDLADYSMPFLAEAMSPRYNPERQVGTNVQRWLDKIAEADGYIIVSPEYNRSMPGVLKNAIDTLDHQMDQKPVSLVTHGVTGGASAADNLRLALRGVGAYTSTLAVTIPGRVGELFEEAGSLAASAAGQTGSPQGMLDALLQELSWLTETLAAGRAKV